MAAVYIAAVVICIAAALAGHALCALCGARAAPPWAPVAGLALLLAVARVAIEAPGYATAAAAACAAATLAGLAVCAAALRRADRRPGAGAPFVDRIPLAAVTLFAASIPFLVAGYAGILGVGDNNDMSAHLTTAWWLDARGPVRPMGALGDSIVGEGYPLGPHALVAAVSRALGVSLVHAFDALTIAVPVLTAVAALGALGRGVPRAARWVAAILIGLTYLGASYLAQDAFKETLMGMLLVAFALALRDLVHQGGRPRAARGIPLGVIAAGTVYVYSAPGLVWIVLTLGALALLAAVRARALPMAGLRAAAPAAAAGLAALVVVAGPEAHHLWTFLHSSFAHEPKDNTGNLLHAIPAAEALGIWFNGDFRRWAVPYWPTVALDAVALVAFALALWRTLRDRELVLPALLVASGVVAAESALFRNIYNTGKSLAILAPAVALILMPWLAAGWRRGAARAVPWRLLGAVVVAGAAASSLLALREAPVGPQDHPRQVEALARTIQGRSVLYINVDDFAQWELRGTLVATGPLLYAPRIVQPREEKNWFQRSPMDVDNFASADLDRFDFMITPGSAYQSSPPANFAIARRTRDFLLWRRTGHTQERTPGEHETGAAGAIARCGLPLAKRIAEPGNYAVLLPTPLVIEESEWRGEPVHPGDTGVATLPQVPAGRWTVSLQYVSATGLDLRVGDLHTRLPATLERLGSFWPAGAFTQRRSGPVTLRVTARGATAFGSALAAQKRTRALSSVDGRPLGRLVLSPTSARPTTVPGSSACGHYVDWYGPAPARAAKP